MKAEKLGEWMGRTMKIEKLGEWMDQIEISDGYGVVMCTDCFDLVKVRSGRDIKGFFEQPESGRKEAIDQSGGEGKEIFGLPRSRGKKSFGSSDGGTFAGKRFRADRLLELRIFDTEREYRLFRGDVGSDFSTAVLDDSLGDFYDDLQYLDIDEKRSAASFRRTGRVRATGGGSYGLPLDDFRGMRLRVRNYLGYDGEGQAYVKAVRLMGFEKEEGDGQER